MCVDDEPNTTNNSLLLLHAANHSHFTRLVSIRSSQRHTIIPQHSTILLTLRTTHEWTKPDKPSRPFAHIQPVHFRPSMRALLHNSHKCIAHVRPRRVFLKPQVCAPRDEETERERANPPIQFDQCHFFNHSLDYNNMFQ